MCKHFHNSISLVVFVKLDSNHVSKFQIQTPKFGRDIEIFRNPRCRHDFSGKMLEFCIIVRPHQKVSVRVRVFLLLAAAYENIAAQSVWK